MKNKIELNPVSFTLWLGILGILLSVPLFTLYRQSSEYFKSERDKSRDRIQRELDNLLGNAIRETDPESWLQQFTYNIFDNDKFLYDEGIRKTEIQKLRRLVPNVKILFFDLSFKINWVISDHFQPKWPFEELVKALGLRKKASSRGEDSPEVHALLTSLGKRWFGEDSPLSQFLRTPKRIVKFEPPYGKGIYCGFRTSGSETEKKAGIGGFMIVVKEDQLPADFGLRHFGSQKRDELKKKKTVLGWTSIKKMKTVFSSPPLSQAHFLDYMKKIHEPKHDWFDSHGILTAYYPFSKNIVVFCSKDISSIGRIFSRQILMLRIFLSLIILGPLSIIFYFRENRGVALSIRWQVLGLFVLAIGLPSLTTFQLGSELLRDHRIAAESEAVKKLEKITEIIEDRFDIGLRWFEDLGEEFLKIVQTTDFSKEGSSASAAEKLNPKFEQGKLQHLLITDDSGKSFFTLSRSPKEMKKMERFFEAFARLKLQLTNKYVEKSGKPSFSAMDLVMEELGGNFGYLRRVLRSDNRAFDFKTASDTMYIYIGIAPAKADPSRNILLLISDRDSHYEERYLHRVVNEIYLETANQGGDLIKGTDFFGVDNHANLDKPIIQSPKPSLQPATENPNLLNELLLNYARPTLTKGVRVFNENFSYGGKNYIFFSMRSRAITKYSLAFLYDYSLVEEKITNLERQTYLYLFLSFLLTVVLSALLSRGILAPLKTLEKGVDLISQGNFDTQISLPGKDELVRLSDSFNSMARGLSERERMTRFLSHGALKAIQDADQTSLGGIRVPATILFSDIRSFTTISEASTPEEVVNLLNSYFARMTGVVAAHNGDIDKFIGDAIMAVFIAPSGKSEPSPAPLAEKAVRCGLEMMQELEKFNLQRREHGLLELAIGVGINSGEVISGNIGAPGRMEHTVIGDAVNLASRLEGMSKLGRHTHVIISRTTLDLVQPFVEVEQLSETAVKGKTQTVEMYEIVRLK